MSFFDYLRTQRRAKELGGTVIKDKYGYTVQVQTDLKPEDMHPVPPEEVLKMFENKDLSKMEPRVRDSILKSIQTAKEEIQKAQDERWRKK